MRHEVPQFIDIEDKIFYWLSFRQAIYLAGGFFGGFLVYKTIVYFFPNIYMIIPLSLGAPFLALGGALAFIKINKRPFSKFLEAWYGYVTSPKRLSWQKKKRDTKIEERFRVDNFQLNTSMSNNNTAYFADQNLNKVKNKKSKLKDLAYQLDMSDELQEESSYYGGSFDF